MPDIKYIKRANGDVILPVTHERAVMDSDGVTLEEKLRQKQTILVSGANIKTINNTSLLGEGNITLPTEITVDSIPGEGSGNPVSSGGVYSALEKKVESEDIDKIVELTKAEFDALSAKDPDTIYVVTDSSVAGDGYVSIADISTVSSLLPGGQNVTTITLSNGQTRTITTLNGATGAQGNTGSSVDYPYELVNNVTTDDATKGLSAAQGVVLQGEITTLTGNITVSDLTDGKYYKLSGSTVPTVIGESQYYACARYHVYPGMKFVLKTYGTSSDARAYAIANASGSFISAATEEGFLTYNLTIPDNGAYLYVNHKKSGGTFSLSSALSQTEQDFLLNSLSESVDGLRGDVTATGTRIDNLPVYKDVVGSDLTSGKYYNLSGSSPTGPYASSSWSYKKISVFAGQKFYLSTVGGNSARAYALTDSDDVVQSVADASVTLTNQLITVAKDGYLYVHCSSSSANISTFQLRSANTQLWLEDNIGAIKGQMVSTVPVTPAYKNPSFPYYKDSLRCLVLGNSYTGNSTAYLSNLLANTNISSSKLCVYNSSPSGYTLDQWLARFGDNETYTITRRAGDPLMHTSGTMEYLVNQAWDVIVINQASTSAYNWNSYKNVKKLVGKLRRYCPNPKLCIAFQMAWSHSGDGVDSDYDGIVECAKRLAAEIGVNYIIPVGMAVKNARSSSLQNAYNLLSDGTHLCKGVGQYIASCTFWESIIAPVMGVSVLGNTATVDVSATEISEEHAVAVTASNRELCQLCAHWATIDMYATTDVESL